jgi:Acetyltransferase (GNAT) domain
MSTRSTDQLTIRRFSRLEESNVRDFLAGQAGATAFHDPDVLRALSPGFGSRVAIYGVFNRDILESVAPVIEGRVWKGTLRGMVYSPWQYIGPVSVDGSHLTRDIRLLQKRWKEDGIKIVHAGFSPWQEVNAEELEGNGIYVLPDVAYPIRLAGMTESELLANMSKGTRKGINRVNKRGGVVLASSTQHEVKDIFPLLSTHSYNHGHDDIQSPYSRKIFELLSQRLDNPLYHATTARYNDHIVGGMISIADRKGATNSGYAIIIGKNYGVVENNQNTNAALFWDAMLWSKDLGHTVFDPVGGGSEGIREFKRRLGGLEVPAPRIKVITDPTIALAWEGAKMARYALHKAQVLRKQARSTIGR